VKRALLTRHAESAASVDGRTSGDPRRRVPLTEAGREQAHALRERLAHEELELCVVTEFLRTQETADIALEGRDLPRLVLPALDDIRFGDYEGRLLADYRVWARAHGPEDVVPGGDESRADAVRRYAGAFRTLIGRPEPSILVVAHSLPIRYALEYNVLLPLNLGAAGVDRQVAAVAPDHQVPTLLPSSHTNSPCSPTGVWLLSGHRSSES